MIDRSRLRELVDDFGEDDLMDLIESFLEEAAEAVEGLRAMVSETYSEERSQRFHFLKGCALNLGATELGELCETLEKRDGGFSESEYDDFCVQFQSVQNYFADADLKLSA
ncbi:MAG: Hpt domain-containing protein [Pseudomonadota bacterium]